MLQLLLINGGFGTDILLVLLLNPVADEFAETGLLGKVALLLDGPFEALQVLLDGSIGEVVGSVGVVEGFVPLRLLAQHAPVVEAVLFEAVLEGGGLLLDPQSVCFISFIEVWQLHLNIILPQEGSPHTGWLQAVG